MRYWTPGAYYTAAIVGVSVTIVQFHAITFWSEHAAHITGWLFAVGLEMLVLWLWFQRRIGYQLVGLVGTLILLAGPVYTISADLIETLQYAQADDNARAMRVESLRHDIEQLESDLATFRANSEERTGWLPIIRDTQQQLAEKRIQKRELESQREDADLIWLNAALLVVQVIAVVLFHVGAVLGITWLSARLDRVRMEQSMEHPRSEGMEHPMEHPRSEGMEHPMERMEQSMEHPMERMEQSMEHPRSEGMEHPMERMEQSMEHPRSEGMEHPRSEGMEQSSRIHEHLSTTSPAIVGMHALDEQPAPPPSQGDIDEIPLAAILRAVDRLKAHLEESGESVSGFAARCGVPRRDVSLFLRHQEKVQDGKRRASMARIRTIMAAIP